MCQKLPIILLFSFVFTAATFAQQGKLNKAKQSLKSSNSSGTITSSKSASSGLYVHDDDDYINPFAAIVWYPIFYTVYSTFIESPWEMKGKMHDAEFSIYPYKNKKYGNFIYTNTTNYTIVRLDVYNHFFVENSNLFGNDLGIDFKFLKRFSLDVNYTTLQEKFAGKRGSFNLFSALLKYYRIRTQRLDAWFGLGFRSVFNTVNETRFLLGFGGELFVVKPISLSASYKWATVNQQPVRNTKLLLKYHVKNYRIATGFEQYILGVSKINAFSFGVEASF